MEQQEFKYFAFISYNSADDKWAKWLQNKLETYNLPTIIKNEKGEVIKSYDKKPKKFKIFRYVSDLNAKTLTDGLSEELDNSQNLIVICSPRSAKSEWVGKEIQHFIDTGRKKKIVPFIVEGTSYSNDENECLNPILKQHFPKGDLLGVNINERGDTSRLFAKRKAVAKTVALLLEVPNAYNFLWNRYRHQLYKNIALCILLCLAVMASLVYVWQTNQPVDISMRLNEVSVHNNQLPPLKDAVVTMTLDNETKTDTIASLDDTALFTNVPHHFLDKEVRVSVVCKDYLPVDTLIMLTKEPVINIQRNSSVYGDIRFRLWNPAKDVAVANSEMEIEGEKVVSDHEGIIQLTLPIERQKPVYKLSSSTPLETDSLFMPCGEDDVILTR